MVEKNDKLTPVTSKLAAVVLRTEEAKCSELCMSYLGGKAHYHQTN